ncbi:MarR family transcriptional regulator [Desulfosporosinus sp. PR]|uniref:MarR family winged helix-turn-helix transcriptional regulator n=1 Tax=Candidatus Desulfosporosinus nitrosoreducens TaxID=3401928 RepID=UPI0027F8FFE2|nr:MarR family transcriptional regulator [Desulfosporosinus sp. PR]MDQ7095594.1 MarR family transcriptional regulator [Desulfosporosinus sp. PR]
MITEAELATMEETDLLFRKVWRKYQSFLLPATGDLSLHQTMFLKFLEYQGTCTPSDVAQQFGITLGAVTGFVNRLNKVGLIARARSEKDRRVVLIQISPRGRDVLKAYESQRKEKFNAIMLKLESSSLVELKKILEQLNSVLNDVLNK